MGAVSTTLMAGVGVGPQRKSSADRVAYAARNDSSLANRTDNNSPLIKKLVPLADLNDLVFGGWDLFKDDAYQAAEKAAC